MWKYILLVTAALFLVACKPDTRQELVSESDQTYKVECIDGVEYWKQRRGYNGYMSPRINPETLEFVRCGSK